jgi:hypothetical protein
VAHGYPIGRVAALGRCIPRSMSGWVSPRGSSERATIPDLPSLIGLTADDAGAGSAFLLDLH